MAPRPRARSAAVCGSTSKPRKPASSIAPTFVARSGSAGDPEGAPLADGLAGGTDGDAAGDPGPVTDAPSCAERHAATTAAAAAPPPSAISNSRLVSLTTGTLPHPPAGQDGPRTLCW